MGHIEGTARSPEGPAAGLILQFGTSRFLQAHVDLIVHEARADGQHVPDIIIVQTSGSAARAGRVAAFADPAGFPVIVRGIEDGVPVERQTQVRSVVDGLSVQGDWARVVDLFVNQTRFVVSNTGDRGYDLNADDHAAALDITAPRASFPGKMAQLLYARWQAGRPGLVILPCELINGNGPILKNLIRDLARDAAGGADFLSWLDTQVVMPATLVDRIVSEPLAPAGAVAEPYALWAIQDVPGLTLPCRHPAIVVADSLEPHERLKLHILNLGHTVLADIWLNGDRAADETVRAILTDPGVVAQLDHIYRTEVLPGFAAHGMADAAESYLDTTMARFANPYLDHRIADIAGNHPQKVDRRIAAFLDWAGTPAPHLSRIVERDEVEA